MNPDRVIFVYNADEGLFNALMDTAHKIFSPATYECSLCRFTYGLTGMVRPWKNFVASLGVPAVFFHRNEFRREFPRLAIALPSILAESGGRQSVLLSADDIRGAGDLDRLMARLRERLAAFGSGPG